MKKSRYTLYIGLLALLAMLGYLASDMYLPAFPDIKQTLLTQKSLVVLTVSFYLCGLAVGQIFYGFLSDHFGRKNTLLAGLLVFLIGSIGCYFSPTIAWLLFWRVLQALGVCATTVLWQAIVIDQFDHDQTQMIFGIIFPLLGLSPALAPVVGGYLTLQFGWRSIFLVLSLLAIVLIAIIVLLLKETKQKQHHDGIKFSTILANYKRLGGSLYYMGYVFMVCLSTSCFFTYLAGSPFVFKSIGFTTHEIGLSYIPQTLCFMLGGFLCKRLNAWISPLWSLGLALLMTLLCGFLFLWVSSLGVHHGYQVIAPFLLIAIANGIVYPTCMSIALKKFSDIAGTAAGFSGFAQAMTAFVVTTIVAGLSGWGLLGVAVIITLLAVANLLLFWLLATKTQNALVPQR